MSSLIDKEILIIDDASDVRALARKILENDGAKVSEADSIASGMAACRALQPHLILIDLSFPDSSGFEFLSARKSDPALARIPSIVLSGSKDMKTVSQAIALGISDYIIKPFRATLLLQKVRKALAAPGFGTYRFENEKLSELTFSLPATVQQLDETGFLLECAAKLAPDELVNVKSDIFASDDLMKVVKKVSGKPSAYLGPGRYQSQILFSGVGEAFMKKIRKLVGE